MIKIVPVFTIRVIYKSGYVHEFDVYAFDYNGIAYKWRDADVNNNPINFGAEEVAAVWQVGVKKKLKWSKD